MVYSGAGHETAPTVMYGGYLLNIGNQLVSIHLNTVLLLDTRVGLA